MQPEQPPPDQPVDVFAFERADALRRRLLQAGCCLGLVGSAAWTALASSRANRFPTWDLAAVLYWVIPLAALLPRAWHLPATLLLLGLLPLLPVALHGALLWTSLAWAAGLGLLAGTSPRRPEMLAASPFDDTTSPRDDDEADSDGELSPKEAFLGRQQGSVTGPAQASVLSALLLQWPLPLLAISQRVPMLQPYHLPVLPFAIRARAVAAQQPVVRMLARLLHPTAAGSPPDERAWTRLLGELWTVNWRSILVLVALAVVKSLLTFIPAYLLSEIIRSLEDSPDAAGSGGRPYQLALCVGLAGAGAFSGILASHASYWEMAAVSKPILFQLRTLLCEKTLLRKNVTPTGQAGHAGGKTQVMNLFTLDVPRIARIGEDIAGVSTAIVDLAIGTTLLYSLLGWSALLGLALNAVTIPFNKALASYTLDVDDRRSRARDERTSAVDEVLAGIRGVKLEAAEDNWEARIERLRREEVRLQRRRYTLGTAYNLLWGSLPVLCILVSLTSFSLLQGGQLTPHVAFPSLAIFNALTLVWTVIPGTMVKLVETVVSLRRIAAYLGAPEVERLPPSETAPLLVDTRESFSLLRVSLAYPRDVGLEANDASTHFRLRSLSLRLRVGQLNLVVGPVAAGKSLFLLGLLGEADVLEGSHDFPRSRPAVSLPGPTHVSDADWLVEGTAYVPQTAWLQNASVRANILFGLPLEEGRYQQVLDCCCLRSDLLLLPDGDRTEIGERGLTLSGGQKARVSLARAIYSRARHLLIDDCLSAVDAHTAQGIFSGLRGPLLHDRTVVLCTHHVSLCLPAAHTVVALKNGKLLFTSGGKEFAASAHFKGFIEEPETTPVEAEIEVALAEQPPAAPVDAAESKALKARKLVAAEKREIGGISLSAYTTFLQACGGFVYWLVFATAYVGTQALELLSAWWLRKWTAATTTDRSEIQRYLVVYALITLAGVAGSAVRWIVLYDGMTTRASARIHKRLLHSVIRAPVHFFDTTAHGALLNRFSSDMSRVDGFIPDDFARVAMLTLGLGCSIGILCVVTPIFAVAVLVLAPVFYVVGRSYAKIARDFRRLDNLSLSPLYGLFAEVIGGGGLAVIRSFGCSQAFMERMLSRMDEQTSRAYHGFTVYLWLVTTFGLLNSILTGCAGVILILLGLDAASTGFALTWALNLGPEMLALMLRYTSLELTMVSVERIDGLSAVPPGAPELTAVRPPAGWPTAGALDIDGLTARYAPELPDVLHDVSFSVRPGEKVGVCGATGSGKSTLALSLFRMVEPHAGRIVVDGIDIASLGTQDLRSRLAIIPQDPSLVSGTLRSTLDQRGEHSDAELFAVLRRVHLLPIAGDDDGGDAAGRQPAHSGFRSLDSPIAQHGSNLSLGERQLLVLARALLRGARLLVLDEATSSVDFETDELITRALAQTFASSTLLVIAHRLRTVVRFDRVLVLSQGRVVEFDSPAALLADPTSAFAALCRRSGELGPLTLLAQQGRSAHEADDLEAVGAGAGAGGRPAG